MNVVIDVGLFASKHMHHNITTHASQHHNTCICLLSIIVFIVLVIVAVSLSTLTESVLQSPLNDNNNM